MSRPPGLRVVDGDTPEKTPNAKLSKTPAGVTSACDSGDRRKVMIALRTRLAKAIDDPRTPARDLAALSRRLIEVTKDLESLDAAVEREGSESGPTPDERWEAI